jgi:hypothetical protein
VTGCGASSPKKRRVVEETMKPGSSVSIVLAGWVGQMAALLTPLSEAIASHARDGRALHAGDSLWVL